MRTWYDTTRRAWVTQEASGRIRQATMGEALAANQQAQAPAGVALPSQSITAQNAQEYSPATSPGYGAAWAMPTGTTAPDWMRPEGIGVAPVAPEGSPAGGITPSGAWPGGALAPTFPTSGTGWGAPVAVPTGATPVAWPQQTGVGGQAPPPPPDPNSIEGWHVANTGSRSWRYLTPELQAYYEQNPDEAFRQYSSAEFGDRQTPMTDYAKSRYQDYWAQYIKASESDPTGGAGWTNYLSNNLAGQIRDSFQQQSPSQKGYALMFQPAGRIA